MIGKYTFYHWPITIDYNKSFVLYDVIVIVIVTKSCFDSQRITNDKLMNILLLCQTYNIMLMILFIVHISKIKNNLL